MKKLIIIFVIIILLGIGGYFLFNSISKPKMISSNSEPVSVCSDTDGNNIYEKGYSDYIFTDNTKRAMEDICDYSSAYSKSNVGVVREGYCAGNNFKTELWTCGRGFVCRNGKCIQGDSNLPVCSDTDGGINAKLRGDTNNGVSSLDNCWVTTSNNENDGAYSDLCEKEFVSSGRCYVYEYYCDKDNLKQHQIIKCPIGCSNGACL